MRRYKSGIYKASNVTFDPIKMEAYSHGWWLFVKRINGLVVFNSYRYSNSTIKHQHKVRKLMEQLGIHIDIDIEVPDGLQFVSSAMLYYRNKADKITKELLNPRIRNRLERVNTILAIEHSMNQVKRIV